MGYKSLKKCVEDLERHGQLVRISIEVDPNLEMAAIQRRVYAAGGPAIFFENVKGSKFPAVSNLFGTLERSKFLFRDSLESVKKMVALKGDPAQLFKNLSSYLGVPMVALSALPVKARFSTPALQNKTTIAELPQIKSWPDDGGPFITLPVVYTEDVEKPGIMNSNMGMYRIQLGGNDYVENEEIGLHYQLHRGIGVHQTKSNNAGLPLKVSIFVGGPPANIMAGVMPLPEGISETTFAGGLGKRNFRYIRKDGHVLSTDADFVITGEVHQSQNKPEGPFGDHLGYYSLEHDYPVMKVNNVYHRNDAIWPFTVVGRPPQEDTSFGALIHEMVGGVVSSELPGVHEVHAVDECGVHPLLLAIGSERYTPYSKLQQPQEILTQANNILGFGQMSLAKYLFMANFRDNPHLDIHNVESFFAHMLSRIDFRRDLHFHTKTTIDTLDYTGEGLNSGSKVVFAAVGEPKRELATSIPARLTLAQGFSNPQLVMKGVVAVTSPKFQNEEQGTETAGLFCETLSQLPEDVLSETPLIVLVDDSDFVSRNFNNFLWVTFTRSNPAHDIHGVNAFTKNKHWGCHGPLVIDARIKPHHAPPLLEDPEIEKRVDDLGAKGQVLHGVI